MNSQIQKSQVLFLDELGVKICGGSRPVCVVQAQHSHHVIQQVLNHLDTNNKSTPRVRAGIVQVLLETVAIAAKGSVGESDFRTVGERVWNFASLRRGMVGNVVPSSSLV